MSDKPARYTPSILVGVDGSPHSDDALRWAAMQAGRRGERIDVVASWHVPYGPIEGLAGGATAVARNQFDFEASAKTALAETLQRCAGSLDGIDVSTHVIQGKPTDVLVDFARQHNSVLMVVGTRGRGGFAGLMLGSTSRATADRSPCPVAVVPPATRGDVARDPSGGSNKWPKY